MKRVANVSLIFGPIMLDAKRPLGLPYPWSQVSSNPARSRNYPFPHPRIIHEGGTPFAPALKWRAKFEESPEAPMKAGVLQGVKVSQA